MSGTTRTLAEYIVKARLEDFPEEVIRKGRRLVQNEIGCGLGAAQTDLGQRTIAVARELGLGGRPESTIIGDGARISSVMAAHANTELCEMLDFDDEHKLTLSHPSCAILSTALAVGEMVDASGKDFLTAVLVGYEVSLRIGRAIRSIITRPDGKQEVLSNPAYIVFGSIATAGKLLGLNAAKIENAFGLAGSTPINRGQALVHMASTGLGSNPYTENKFDMGMYALLGVLNALRARRIAGPQAILDSDRFWSRCSATACDYADMTKGLGRDFRIMEMSVKPICFCGVTLAPVTAIREALKGERLDPDEIEEIKLIGIPRLPFKSWNTMVEAEFSTPCAVALAVSGDEPGPDWYTSGRYKDPEIMKIASKVTFEEDPRAKPLALEKAVWICTAEIRTRDGRVRRAFVDHEKGTPANPLTEDELCHKFMVNSQGLLGQERSRDLWNTLLDLERINKISSIVLMLASL